MHVDHRIMDSKKSQLDRVKEAACDLEPDDDKAAPNAKLVKQRPAPEADKADH